LIYGIGEELRGREEVKKFPGERNLSNENFHECFPSPPFFWFRLKRPHKKSNFIAIALSRIIAELAD